MPGDVSARCGLPALARAVLAVPALAVIATAALIARAVIKYESGRMTDVTVYSRPAHGRMIP